MNNINFIEVGKIKKGERLFSTLNVEDMDKLVESIQENGILTPLLVSREGDYFELKSGYNRLDAALSAGMDKVPCIVVSESKNLAATYHTDIIRRHMSPQEKLEMVKLMDYHQNPDSCADNIIPEFRSIKTLLSEKTLIALAQMPKEDQLSFYRSIPEKHKEDVTRVNELEKELTQYKIKVNDLEQSSKKTEDEIKQLKMVSDQYEVLKKSKQVELNKIIEEKTKELEEKYQNSDDAIKVAVEAERAKVEEKLQREIEEAREKQNEFSRLADTKTQEAAIAKETITKLNDAIKEAKAEQEKTLRAKMNLQNVVSRVASLKAVLERGKAVLVDLDQIRHNIIMCGDEVLLQDKSGTKAIHELLDKAYAVLEEIKNALEVKIQKRVSQNIAE